MYTIICIFLFPKLMYIHLLWSCFLQKGKQIEVQPEHVPVTGESSDEAKDLHAHGLQHTLYQTVSIVL